MEGKNKTRSIVCHLKLLSRRTHDLYVVANWQTVNSVSILASLFDIECHKRIDYTETRINRCVYKLIV